MYQMKKLCFNNCSFRVCDGRFLVSFNGKYLKNSCCRLTSHVKNRPYNVHGGDYVHDSEHEVFRISINQAEAEEYGPAFIEVTKKTHDCSSFS